MRSPEYYKLVREIFEIKLRKIKEIHEIYGIYDIQYDIQKVYIYMLKNNQDWELEMFQALHWAYQSVMEGKRQEISMKGREEK